MSKTQHSVLSVTTNVDYALPSPWVAEVLAGMCRCVPFCVQAEHRLCMPYLFQHMHTLLPFHMQTVLPHKHAFCHFHECAYFYRFYNCTRFGRFHRRTHGYHCSVAMHSMLHPTSSADGVIRVQGQITTGAQRSVHYNPQEIAEMPPLS